MLSQLHKKPISTRKKIALAAILIASCAIIIPLWLLGISQTLNESSKLHTTKTAKNNAQTFAELEKQFSTAMANYQELKKAIDDLKKTLQTKTNQQKELQPNQGKLPTLPGAKNSAEIN